MTDRKCRTFYECLILNDTVRFILDKIKTIFFSVCRQSKRILNNDLLDFVELRNNSLILDEAKLTEQSIYRKVRQMILPKFLMEEKS